MEAVNVVLDASGGAGSAVVRELASRGRRVRAVSRSGRGAPLSGVERVRADVFDAAGLREVCRGAAVIYHCANLPYTKWATRLLPMADAIVSASADAGAKLVAMDNLYMYGRVRAPITETTPRNAHGKKGRVRYQLECLLLDAHRSGRVRVTIGRASDFYGPQANSAPMFLAVTPALRGRRASWLGSLDAPHTLNYLPDVARGLVTLGDREESLGEIWHLPADAALTGRQFIEMVFHELGQRPRMGLIRRPLMVLVALFSPMVREGLEVLYQFERPFVVDAGKFEKAFGRRVTPHREALRQTLEALRAEARV